MVIVNYTTASVNSTPVATSFNTIEVYVLLAMALHGGWGQYYPPAFCLFQPPKGPKWY